jgi:hypothetical protein
MLFDVLKYLFDENKIIASRKFISHQASRIFVQHPANSEMKAASGSDYIM